MASEFNIAVDIDTARARSELGSFNKGLKESENQAQNLKKILSRAFQLATIGVAVREYVQLADTFTNLQNRLRTVTDGEAELTKTTEALFQIAQRTRSSFEGTADIFSRVALATKDLGRTQEETLQFTESLNQAIILSGASAQAAQAGLMQLGQALGSGVLRGEELNSVLEQLPEVADVIAKSLGVARGALRGIAEQGQITAEVVLKAFADAREELAERFAKTVPTISQSFTALRNSVIKLIGDFDTAYGPSKVLSQIILKIAENAEVVARAFGAAAIVIGVHLAREALTQAIAGFKALNLAISANPIGALVQAITIAISLIIAFGDEIVLVEGKMATLQDVAAIVWDNIANAVRTFINFFSNNIGIIFDNSSTVFNSLSDIFKDGFVRGVVRMLDNLIGFFVGFEKAVIEIFTNLPAILRDIFVRAFNSILKTMEEVVNGIIYLVNELTDAVGLGAEITMVRLGKLGEDTGATFSDLGSRIGDAFLQGINVRPVEAALDGLLAKAEEHAQKRIELIKLEEKAKKEAAEQLKRDKVDKERTSQRSAQQQAFLAALKNLKSEADLLRASNDERDRLTKLLKIEQSIKGGLTSNQRERIDGQLRINEELERQASLLEQINGATDEFKSTQQSLNLLLQQGKISVDQYNQALSQTELGSKLQDLGIAGDLGIGKDPLKEEQSLYQRRLAALQTFLQLRAITEEEALALREKYLQEHNEAVEAEEIERYKLVLNAGQKTFDALTNATKNFAGEQSAVYRAMFAVSKAFAIAETSVAIAQGIAKAAAEGWPANIPSIAQTIAQTAGLIAQISSTTVGFKTGGSFQVGGSGGADSQTVMFRASPNETVSVRTPSQQRVAERQDQPAQPIENKILNIVDPNLISEALSSAQGQKVVLNVIGRNRQQISTMLTRGRR
jgi:tape measure domain-containing protein